MPFLHSQANSTKFLNQVSEELGYQVNNPTQPIGWVNGPDFRGTLDLVWTCVFTLFTCLWASLHLNVPAPSDTEWIKFRRKLKYTCIAATFPEALIGMAFVNWWDARHDVAIMRKYGFDNWNWKLCAFVRMGGVWLHGKPDHNNETATSATPAQIETDHFLCVETDVLRTLIQARILEQDCLKPEMIDEKSKQDWIVKLIACWQMLYFTLQCISRWVLGLPLTTLEISTVTFAAYALVIYLLWWNKPVDISMPIVFTIGQNALDDVSRLYDTSVPERPWWKEYRFVISLDRNNISISKNWRLPNSFSATGGLQLGVCLYPVLLSAFLFAGPHFIAWNFDFPSQSERYLWRISCIIMVAVPLLSTTLIFLGIRPGWLKVGSAYTSVRSIATVIYATARFYLIIEGFVYLRAAPIGCYQEIDWAGFIPHIG
ncbi:hypothetical protein F4819DRAFT_334206 [Hypoxylon fuscum]|nr:hypothetical protein F4819DRAFT_334206 [Hypoxylon fuscum]